MVVFCRDSPATNMDCQTLVKPPEVDKPVHCAYSIQPPSKLLLIGVSSLSIRDRNLAHTASQPGHLGSQLHLNLKSFRMQCHPPQEIGPERLKTYLDVV